MKKIFLLTVSLCVVFSLQAQTGTKSKTTKSTTSTATAQAAKAYLSLESNTLSFGNVKVGQPKTIELKFTNTGKKTLVFLDAFTTCGCTTVDWPKEPFTPGKSGIIKVIYNPAPSDEGPFSKTITLYSNASNDSEIIKVEGLAIPK